MIDHKPVPSRGRRVALLTNEYCADLPNAGGLGIYIKRMADALVATGNEPEVFVVGDRNEGTRTEDDVPVHRVAPIYNAPMRALRRASGRGRSLRARHVLPHLAGARALARTLEERHAVHAFDFVQSTDAGLTGLFVRPRRSRPHVVRCSWDRDLWQEGLPDGGWLDEGLIRLLTRLVFHRATRVYAPSGWLAERLTRRYGVAVGTVRPAFGLGAEAAPLDRKVTDVPPRYLAHHGTVGRLKGSDLLADALPIAWRTAPDLAMVWAGRESRAGIVEEYRKLWGDRSAQVVYLGAVSRPVLHAVVKEAVASVLPSRYDNFPNSVLESLALGTPVIGPLGASFDEIVESGVHGELISPEDGRSLAEVLVGAWRRLFPWVGRSFPLPAVFDRLTPANAVSDLFRCAGLAQAVP